MAVKVSMYGKSGSHTRGTMQICLQRRLLTPPSPLTQPPHSPHPPTRLPDNLLRSAVLFPPCTMLQVCSAADAGAEKERSMSLGPRHPKRGGSIKQFAEVYEQPFVPGRFGDAVSWATQEGKKYMRISVLPHFL